MRRWYSHPWSEQICTGDGEFKVHVLGSCFVPFLPILDTICGIHVFPYDGHWLPSFSSGCPSPALYAGSSSLTFSLLEVFRPSYIHTKGLYSHPWPQLSEHWQFPNSHDNSALIWTPNQCPLGLLTAQRQYKKKLGSLSSNPKPRVSDSCLLTGSPCQ